MFQLPPSLEFEPAAVTDFLKLLRQNFAGDVVWEPRHKSWFEDDATELLSSFRLARVAADPACVPKAADPGAASDVVYFRLHGSPRRYYSTYESDFLETLAIRLAKSAVAAKTWCVFDNTALGAATRNAPGISAPTRSEKLLAQRNWARNAVSSSGSGASRAIGFSVAGCLNSTAAAWKKFLPNVITAGAPGGGFRLPRFSSLGAP